MEETPEQVGKRWLGLLWERLRASAHREGLREAAAGEDLATWTTLMTAEVVGTCQAMGWVVAAKGHKLELLPQPGQEYLSLDAMAFAPPVGDAGGGWHWPVAVVELENKISDERTGYSLWKVLNVIAALRVVVAYRRDWEAANRLPGVLGERVVRSMGMERWGSIEGEVLLVVGSRSEAAFPYDYFRFHRYDRGVGKFVKADFSVE